METEYGKIINAQLARLNTDTGREWVHESTGGGCDCYELTIGNGYYMITCDAMAPTTDEEWNEVTLGFYADVNRYDEATWLVEGTRADVLAVFAEKVGK